MTKRMTVAVLSLVGFFLAAYLTLYKLGYIETLACGTGVTAAGLIYGALSDAPSPVRLLVRGGDWLEVGFQRVGTGFENVTLKGPADFVFDGSIEIP